MQKIIERKKKPFHFKRSNAQRKAKRTENVPYYKPEIVPALKNVLARIGKPPSTPFVPDDFQVKALEAINKTDCLVIAPTGSGKTWIAREAILSALERAGAPGTLRR